MLGKNYHQRFGKKFPLYPSFQRQMVSLLVWSFSWDVLFQETPSGTVIDGPDEPNVTETTAGATEATEVGEGAEATAKVSNHIIAVSYNN